MSDTLLASASRVLWRTITSYGHDANALFSAAGLDPARINDPLFRYPVENIRRAWALAAEQLPDPCFGVHSGEHWLSTDLHALGFAFLSSATLKNALLRIVRFNAIVDNVITFEAEQHGDHLLLGYRNDREDLPDIPGLEVARWSIVTAMCRAACNARFCPQRMELVQSLPDCKPAYREYFGCDIVMGQSHSRMICSMEELLRPLPALNSNLAAINDRAITEYLDRLRGDELPGKVAQVIRDHLANGDLSDDVVAAALCMSPRTLQRKLAAANTSYSQILREVRTRLARDYLADDRLSLTEVSFLLGFSEASAFTRAFKRWTGSSPSQIRQGPSQA